MVIDKKFLKDYARLVVRRGANVQQGEHVFVNAPVSAPELARMIVEESYQAGACKVTVMWRDEMTSKLHYIYQSEDALGKVEDWVRVQRNGIVDAKGVTISIISDDPNLFADVDAAKMAIGMRALSEAVKPYREATMDNTIRWSLIACPNEAWARTVFPNEKDGAVAVEKLWQLIGKACMLNTENVVKAWENKQVEVSRRRSTLNSAKIVKMHYSSKNGTEFTVGLPKNYVFQGGSELGKDGIEFTANLPTEEVFSAPDRNTAEGKLVSAMPLIHNGVAIENFWMEFKQGRVVDFGAEKGYDVLREIIETDEGSHYLGEIALVGYNSPIRNLETLFYNTLFDENAACHFALGGAYPTCVVGGGEMTEDERAKAGLNSSLEHVDFMVGTDDLSIVGITEDGNELVIFREGNWVI